MRTTVITCDACQKDLTDPKAGGWFFRLDQGEHKHPSTITRNVDCDLCPDCAAKVRAAVRAMGVPWLEPDAG